VRTRQLALLLLRLGVAALFLLPLLFVVLAAFRPVGHSPAALFGPGRLTLEQFGRLFTILPITRYTINSLRLVATAVPLTVLCASWAGFAMARLPRPAQRRWVTLSFALLLIPGVALWSSRFLIYSRLGLVDSPAVLIAPALMGTSPFFVLMFYRAFRRIPATLYDAATLDGAGVLATWGRVAMPIARSTAAAVGVLTLILYWGDFVSPLLYLRDANDYTLPVALELLQQLGRSDYPLLMAGALWAMLIPAALVVGGVAVVALWERRSPAPRQEETT
jgi:multiple sugar transport system permease protein